MIAGTLGPVASAFSVCALARPWRQHLRPGQNIDQGTFVKDPPWYFSTLYFPSPPLTLRRLLIINAIQLAMALVANAFLLLNMARRVRFSIAQPITIVGWYTSAILLVSLTATAAGPLLDGLPDPPDQYRWSQAFWYGIWAAILYFSMASFMAVTFWGAWTSHYENDFYLTSSQRTLMLQTIMFLMYVLLGALVFSHTDGWNYLDAVYWADVTLFTVGFGDYHPSSNLGRALLIPYALVGIISLGLVIASIRSMILERGRKRMSARMEEKARRRTVRSMTAKGNDAILNPMFEELDSSPSSRSSLRPENVPTNEYERRKVEFELMRKIQNQVSSRRKWFDMGVATGSWLVLWLVGAAIFLQCERDYQGWSYFTSFYFCFTALTTIGYGDVSPQSNAGKSFFVFWSLLALPTMTVLISNAGDTVVKFIREATLQLGNITILPGDEGFMGNLKHVVSMLTFGQVFRDYEIFPKPSPSEFLAQTSDATEEESGGSLEQQHQQTSPAEVEERGRSNFLDVERAQGGDEPQRRAPSTFTSKVRRSLSRLRDPLDELPSGTDFHFLLISEIQVVSRHIRQTPPRRYSFEEWAWYLKLIGEDERDASNHRKPRPKDPKQGDQAGHDELDRKPPSHPVSDVRTEDGQELTWSWVGNRSPLMGSQEESEWILDRLTNHLRESLSAERRFQLKKKPRTTNRLSKSLGVIKAASAIASGLSEKREQ